MIVANGLYRASLRVLRLALRAVARGNSKLATGVRGRRRDGPAFLEWARTRDRTRPCVWVHAPSVGEGIQARAVVRALLDARPELEIAFTWFSPSVEHFPLDMPASWSGYLPWDLPDALVPVLEALAPRALVFGKTEVWPTLAEEAERRGIPLALIGATVGSRAGRMRWPTPWLLGPTYARLKVVAAVGEEDRDRLVRLGVGRDRIEVTGDPAVDAALDRLTRTRGAAHGIRVPDATFCVVAGSTWPADEIFLVAALDELRREGDVFAVLAPHEPTARAVAALLERLGDYGWSAAALAEVEGDSDSSPLVSRTASAGGRPDRPGSGSAVVVDRVGLLAELYGLADVAFVGGGFHDRGLHSVVEPAAAGVPVVFGAQHRGSAAARELTLAGGAFAARGPVELAERLAEWRDDPATRARAGDAALEALNRHRGAAARTARLLSALIDGSG